MKILQPVWLAALPVAAVLTFPSAPLYAQDRPAVAPAASAVTRDQVRKEAAEANKAHRIEHGEAGDSSAMPPDKAKARQSTVSRADVKKDAATANKAHRLEHGEAGDSSAMPPDKAKAKLSTGKAAAVKHEPAAANKPRSPPPREVASPPTPTPSHNRTCRPCCATTSHTARVTATSWTLSGCAERPCFERMSETMPPSVPPIGAAGPNEGGAFDGMIDADNPVYNAPQW